VAAYSFATTAFSQRSLMLYSKRWILKTKNSIYQMNMNMKRMQFILLSLRKKEGQTLVLFKDRKKMEY
jgi:hypothetical protein